MICIGLYGCAFPSAPYYDDYTPPHCSGDSCHKQVTDAGVDAGPDANKDH